MDTVLVKFAGLAREFSVSKTLVEFKLPFLGNTVSIKWYGAIIAFGFVLAVLFGGRVAYKWKISLDKMVDILISGTVFGILGARLYYVAFEWDYYSQHLDQILNIRGGGLAIYGGIIFGILAAFVTAKIERVNFLNLLDMVGMSLLIGQGIGRWGNFANQEAFGSFTTKPWGMMSDTILAYIQSHPSEFGFENMTSSEIGAYVIENDLYVHPTFLYESLWCLLSFAILYIILKKFRKFSGQLFLTYGVLYGLERAVVEGLRTDSLYIGNTSLRVSQLVSICLASVCFVLLVIFLIKYTKHPKPIEGVDFFPEKTPKELEEERKAQEKKEQKKLRKEARKVKIRAGKIVKDSREAENVSENIPPVEETVTYSEGDGKNADT
ncbi:MAG: prolipoprotein diacylglyceryl transferase [Acutalibacteraceae bacterium]